MALASKILLAAFVVAVLAVLLSIFSAGKRWGDNSRTLGAHLRTGSASTAPAFDPDALPKDLPAPVARYLRRSIPAGTRPPALVHLTETGSFMAGEGRGWRDFTAEHFAGLSPRGFVWDAKIGMAPGINVRVRDTYIEGKGSMEVKILAMISVLNQRNLPQLSEAALQRHLAEAVWYPWALIPGPDLAWTVIDSLSARATVIDGGHTVSLDFHFDAAGDVVSVRTERRARWVERAFVPTPWEARLSRHNTHDGVRIPYSAEVLWRLPEGEAPYYRGLVTNIAFGLDSASP